MSAHWYHIPFPVFPGLSGVPWSLVSPWQAARPQKKSEIPAYSCVSPQGGLLSGEKTLTQEAVRGPTPCPPDGHPARTSGKPNNPSVPHASILYPQAQRQLLHEELKLVLQQKEERKQEAEPQVTLCRAMEARSRSAEVGVHRPGWQEGTSCVLWASASPPGSWNSKYEGGGLTYVKFSTVCGYKVAAILAFKFKVSLNTELRSLLKNKTKQKQPKRTQLS